MQAILTDSGALIGWFRDPHVCDPQGHDLGFVRAWGYFAYDGSLRGYFEDGLFRNKQGLIVARIGASSTAEPVVDWTTARIKEPAEPPLIIHFPSEFSTEGWRDVFRIH